MRTRHFRWDREAGFEVAIKVIDLENVEDDITDIHRVSQLALFTRSPCKRKLNWKDQENMYETPLQDMGILS